MSKYIEKADELVIGVFNDDLADTYEDRLLIQLVKGNLYVKVSLETIEDMNVLSQLVSSDKLVPTDLSNIEQKILYLNHLLRFVNNNLLDKLKLLSNIEIKVLSNIYIAPNI